MWQYVQSVKEGVVGTVKDAYHTYVHPHFQKDKYKHQIKLGLNRIKLLENKNNNAILTYRKTIFTLMTEEKNDDARAQTELLLQAQGRVTAGKLVSKSLTTALSRVEYIAQWDSKSSPEPPADMAGLLAILIYAASRLNVDELVAIRQQLMHKFGKDWVESCDNNANDAVATQLVAALDIRPPHSSQVIPVMEEIASSQSLKFSPPAEWLEEPVIPREPTPKASSKSDPASGHGGNKIPAHPAHDQHGAKPTGTGEDCTRAHVDDPADFPPPPPPHTTTTPSDPPIPPQGQHTEQEVEKALNELPPPPPPVKGDDTSAFPPPPPPVDTPGPGDVPPPPPPAGRPPPPPAPPATGGPPPPPAPPATGGPPPPPAPSATGGPPPPPPAGAPITVVAPPDDSNAGSSPSGDRGDLLSAIRRFSKDELSRSDIARARSPTQSEADTRRSREPSPGLISPDNPMLDRLAQRREAMESDDDIASSHDGEGCSGDEWD